MSGVEAAAFLGSGILLEVTGVLMYWYLAGDFSSETPTGKKGK